MTVRTPAVSTPAMWDVGRRKRSVEDVVLRRSRRAATSGGTYTVTNRFEVHDESPNDPQAHGTSMDVYIIALVN